MDLVVKSLLEHFRQERELTELPQDEAFEAFAGFCVLNSFYEAEFTPDTFRTGGGGDLGIDVYGIVVNGELLRDAADVREACQAKRLDVQIIIIQAKTSAKFATTVISDLTENLSHVLAPTEVPYDASADIHNFRDCLRAVYEDIAKFADGPPKLHIRYVTTGTQVSAMVAQKADEAAKRLAGSGRFESVEFRCVTGRELRDLYHVATTAVSATFTMPRKVILPKIPGVEQSLQGVLPAAELVNHVLTDSSGGIRKAVFHANVRDFQGYNGVNKEIRDTLRDPIRKQRFAVLNNGITIVARDLRPVGDELHIKDFQIVNGCQTCHVLFDERHELTDDVQVRVSIVHSQDEDVIGGIVAATNRQTAISEEDLSAREAFHKELEQYFSAHDKPRRLYYERRSKQYSERADVEKTRVVSRAHLTRAYAAMFLNEPAKVGHYKTLVTERKNDLFQEGQHVIAYYTAAAAHYRLEWLIRNGRVSNQFRPALYHLLAAIKTRLLKSVNVPSMNAKGADRECERILAVMWDANEAEKLVLDLIPPLQRAIDAEKANGVPLGEMVRTKRFADRVRAEVLGKSS